MNLSKSLARATTMFHAQNGVAGPLYAGGSACYFSKTGTFFSQGSSKSKVDVDSGNGTADTPVRPTNLEIYMPKPNVSDTLSDPENDDDSLPSTPQMVTESSEGLPNCPSDNDVLDHDTRQLIKNVLTYYTGLSRTGWAEKKTLATMKRVVDGVIAKHRYAYNGMLSKLDLDDQVCDMSFITNVAKSLFSDGKTNWGRIVSLVGFGAVVSQRLTERGKEHYVELVGREISTYLLTYQRDWMVKNNAWDGFVDFFHVEDPESSVRNTLMAFAGVAGIGATLAMLIR